MTPSTFRPSIEIWQDYIGDQVFPSFPDLNLLERVTAGSRSADLPAYNLRFGLRFQKQTRIVNGDMPGDTVMHILEIVKNPQSVNLGKSHKI